MSLDFYLAQDGKTILDINITHNLNKMADAAGIYKALWRPDEIGITKASQCIEPLKAGLIELVTNKRKYEEFNPPNGWGSYEGLVSFVTNVLTACCEYPDSDVRVWR
jgi:hypothetical protein